MNTAQDTENVLSERQKADLQRQARLALYQDAGLKAAIQAAVVNYKRLLQQLDRRLEPGEDASLTTAVHGALMRYADECLHRYTKDELSSRKWADTYKEKIANLIDQNGADALAAKVETLVARHMQAVEGQQACQR